MAYTRLNLEYKTISVSATIPRQNNKSITLEGFQIGTCQILTARFAAITSTGGSQVYVEFATTSLTHITGGVWSDVDGSVGGPVYVDVNNNAWLQGSTQANMSGKTIRLFLVRMPA